MAPLRSVTDLLSEQSEETLLRMQESVEAELARLSVEAQQIEQALAKQARRQRSNGRGTLSKEQVFEVVERLGNPVTATEVHSLLKNGQGIDVSLNAVRNHLNRLVDKWHWLVRDDDGRYAPASPNDPDFGAAGVDDIPF